MDTVRQFIDARFDRIAERDDQVKTIMCEVVRLVGTDVALARTLLEMATLVQSARREARHAGH